MAAADVAEAVARRSYGKLIAFLAVRTRDVAAAEDALADAFAAALTHWPLKGCPENPEAWLLTAARRKLIDLARRREVVDGAADELLALTPQYQTDAVPAIPDERLAMLFACAHPAIDAGVRAPLLLQAVLGLDAALIASAFLTSPDAMGKRLVRAKQKIREAGIPFRVPEREELADRLSTVLDAIYCAFGEGWSDPAGTDAARRDLTNEAIYLARLVAELMPGEPEAYGLLALILHAEARRRARRSPDGEYVPFAQQDIALWDEEMMDEAEVLLRRAAKLGAVGRFQLEAALQSAHVARRRTGVSNWTDVVRLYDALRTISPSPVVEINRALAVAESDGPQVALSALDCVADDPALKLYQPYWAALADLLARAGAKDEARRAYEMAIGLERDPAVRAFLQKQQSRLSVR